MSTPGGKGSDPGSGVIRNVVRDGVTSGVAVGSFLALSIPVVGPFLAAGGVCYLGVRAIRRGLQKR